MITILIVDDQNIVRQGIQSLLESSSQLKVVGTAVDGNSAIEQVKILQPDVVLIDIEMPKMNGLTAVQKICQQFPKIKAFILSSHRDPEYLAQALQAGAQGYLLKDSLSEDLEQAIQLVYRGHLQIESNLLRKVLAETFMAKSITPVKQNKFTPVKKTSVQNISSKLNVSANNLSIFDSESPQNNGESKKESLNRATSTINQTILKTTFNEAESQTKQSPNENKEKLQTRQTSKQNPIQLDSNEREQKPHPKTGIFFKHFHRSISRLVIVSLLLIMTATLVRFLDRSQPKPSTASAASSLKPPQIKSVPALGRIEPKGEVIQLSPPNDLQNATVSKLLVTKGDRVKQGQTLAILDNQARKAADVELARQEVKVAQADLAVVKAGAKQGDIEAQVAQVNRLESELKGEIVANNANLSRLQAQWQSETQEKKAIRDRLNTELNSAKIEFQRHQQLDRAGAISASDLDSHRLRVDVNLKNLEEAEAGLNRIFKTLKEEIKQAEAIANQNKKKLQAQITEARSNLDSIVEVRNVDLQRAQAEVDRTLAVLKQVKADLNLAFLKAPADGTIFQINAFPGESVTLEKGVMEFAQTSKMIVVAEVQESDIAKVKLGQIATITSKSKAFTKTIQGKVSYVGLKIGKQDILSTAPGADVDSRIVEVEISLNLDNSNYLDNYTNAKVIIQINL